MVRMGIERRVLTLLNCSETESTVGLPDSQSKSDWQARVLGHTGFNYHWTLPKMNTMESKPKSKLMEIPSNF